MTSLVPEMIDMKLTFQAMDSHWTLLVGTCCSVDRRRPALANRHCSCPKQRCRMIWPSLDTFQPYFDTCIFVYLETKQNIKTIHQFEHQSYRLVSFTAFTPNLKTFETTRRANMADSRPDFRFGSAHAAESTANTQPISLQHGSWIIDRIPRNGDEYSAVVAVLYPATRDSAGRAMAEADNLTGFFTAMTKLGVSNQVFLHPPHIRPSLDEWEDCLLLFSCVPLERIVRCLRIEKLIHISNDFVYNVILDRAVEEVARGRNLDRHALQLEFAHAQWYSGAGYANRQLAATTFGGPDPPPYGPADLRTAGPVAINFLRRHYPSLQLGNIAQDARPPDDGGVPKASDPMESRQDSLRPGAPSQGTSAAAASSSHSFSNTVPDGQYGQVFQTNR